MPSRASLVRLPAQNHPPRDRRFARMSMRRISVVIPTCNRPDLLERCLRALAAQTIPLEEIEVIVSDDGTARLQDEYTAIYPDFHWVEGPRRGPAANRNNGSLHAHTEWIAFVDDDCIPQPRWIEQILLHSTEVDVVEGRTECPGAKDSPFEERVENLSGGVFWSCNLAVRRKEFERIGRFDEDFGEAGGEDMEFAWRLRKHALCTVYVKEALVLHPPRPVSWKKFWWRTWLIRWMSLYRLKTGECSVTTPLLAAVGATLEREIMDLLRTTWHLFSRHDPSRWRTRWFLQAWRWIMFPFVTVHHIIWDFRFRHLLASRIEEPSVSPSK